MGIFTKISQNAFEEMQLDAGMLLNTFNPANPTAPADSAIICATTGGIEINCTPEYSDLAEDVDNAPNNLIEYKHLDSWTCTLGFTALGTSPAVIKLSLGAADIDAQDSSKVTPRRDFKTTDAQDLWWVGDRADGGFVAVKIKKALSTGGLSLKTTKNGKGQISCELTGHVSVNSQDDMPMEFYSVEAPVTGVRLDKHEITVEEGGTVTLKATTTPAGKTVTWASDNNDEATVEAGVVSGVAEGTVEVSATITVESVDYSDKCIVHVVAAEE